MSNKIFDYFLNNLNNFNDIKTFTGSSVDLYTVNDDCLILDIEKISENDPVINYLRTYSSKKTFYLKNKDFEFKFHSFIVDLSEFKNYWYRDYYRDYYRIAIYSDYSSQLLVNKIERIKTIKKLNIVEKRKIKFLKKDL